jgi:hypothetical protein
VESTASDAEGGWAGAGRLALERPIPYPVVPPDEYRRAIALGTRSESGAPGTRYWQQWTHYRLSARILTAEKRLEGRAQINYRNGSPDILGELYLQLAQNVHAEGAERSNPLEVTGGVDLRRVAVDGVELTARDGPDDDLAGYRVSGTTLRLDLATPLLPGGQADIEIDWRFRIPQRGGGARMGWSADNFFFLAYWYPLMAVYDDVDGWQTDPFLGGAEFYAGFGTFELSVDAPQGWVVRATGEHRNAEQTLPEAVLERLAAAGLSDTVVHVLRESDFGAGRATRRSPSGRLQWDFRADSVRDVAFSVTRESLWDATRTPVGDRNGDGEIDHARIEAMYRPAASNWSRAAAFARHVIDFHSRFTGLPYPWPHMTAVEGGGIIGGGMEFPMMTLIGDYNARGDSALYYVTAHELAHMWLPMVVSSNERRRAWMDEGMTTFLENQARKEFFPGNPSDSLDRETYLEVARSGREGEMMRWTDYHYPGRSGVASYSKPATLLVALRGLLGDSLFMEAYRTFIQEWTYRHPTPWDFFATFDRVSGQDLGWFWRSWYYETWTLDQAVEEVMATAEGTRIVISDRGLAPMPTRLLITRVDGERIQREIPVDHWLSGRRTASVTLAGGAPVIRVEIDPDGLFPDVDRLNNVWVR